MGSHSQDMQMNSIASIIKTKVLWGGKIVKCDFWPDSTALYVVTWTVHI